MLGRKCTFTLGKVHPDEVETVINGLSNSTAFGLDLIDTSIIKLIKKEVLPALTHIVNLSIFTRTFPKSWKKSQSYPTAQKRRLAKSKELQTSRNYPYSVKSPRKGDFQPNG